MKKQKLSISDFAQKNKVQKSLKQIKGGDGIGSIDVLDTCIGSVDQLDI